MERRTGSSWEFWGLEGEVKEKKNLESRTEEREERERGAGKEEVEKGFSAKGIFGIFQVRIREHI